ncbi:hypothetical protein JCM10212_002455, partial [Sporobolomyces blumeae]
VITVTNGPYYSDSFTYTAAASTVPPTGNITNPNVPASLGGAGGTTGLGASPDNLQTAAAQRVVVPGFSTSTRPSLSSFATGSFVVFVAGLVGVAAVAS